MGLNSQLMYYSYHKYLYMLHNLEIIIQCNLKPVKPHNVKYILT